MKTEESKLEAQQEQLDIPVVISRFSLDERVYSLRHKNTELLNQLMVIRDML